MKQKKIIIVSRFNNVPSKSKIALTKKWIDTRMDIFMNYTLHSFKAQTNQDFTSYLLYNKTTEDLVQNSISRYKKLPENVKFVSSNLYSVKLKEEIKDFEYVYLVRIDCDDMYHISYVQQLADFEPKSETKAIINQKGYLYDSVGKRLADYFSKSPPFYTLIYKSKEYINGLRYTLPGGHPGAIQLPHEIIDKRNFVYHVHSTNTPNNTTDKFYHRIHNKGLRLITKDVNKINKILENYVG
ncbi:glycosyltransferase [Clostridium sp. OS1-26]|uniref:glycosyltransferase n=1 Tax=Clostridium sp. OS1-26 TaxID=3070681 RepID=UPI0027DEB508|nr:glycosyltransferase [Clostridium sp. OS1-26]WML35815.1 glycosyltransferase [Clostridium sp. OS1-26]